MGGEPGIQVLKHINGKKRPSKQSTTLEQLLNPEQVSVFVIIKITYTATPKAGQQSFKNIQTLFGFRILTLVCVC